MRRLIVLCALCAAVLVTASGCFRDILLDTTETKEEYDSIKTYVRFINNGEFPVDVYVDPNRSAKLCSVNARESKTVDVAPDPTSNTYYLSYHMPFHGATILYTELHMSLSVPAEQTSDGRIPLLSDLSEAEKQQKITEDVYIVVNNKSGFPLSLMRGDSTPIDLVDSSSYILNGGSKGQYILPANQGLELANYSFRNENNTNKIPWPPTLTDKFENGRLYSFEFSQSSLTVNGPWEMTIANTLSQ